MYIICHNLYVHLSVHRTLEKVTDMRYVYLLGIDSFMVMQITAIFSIFCKHEISVSFLATYAKVSAM